MSNWEMKQDIGDLSIMAGDKFIDGTAVMLGGNDGGIWKSTDNGLTWTKIENLKDRDSDFRNTYSFCVVDSNTGLLGMHILGSIFKTSDRGDSWTEVIRLARNYEISYDGFGGSSFVPGEVVTWDSGSSTGSVMACTNGDPTGTMTINVVAGSLANNDAISAAGSGGTCNVTGTAVQTIIDTVYTITCVNASGSDSILMAGTVDVSEMYRSEDCGENWYQCQTGSVPGETAIRHLETVYQHGTDGVVLAGTGGGAEIWRSTNSGATFSQAYDIAGEQHANRFCVIKEGQTDGVVLCGTIGACEIWRSVDSGLNWTQIASLQDTAIDRGTPSQFRRFCKISESHILASVYDQTRDNAYILESFDGGVSWKEKNSVNIIEGLDYAKMGQASMYWEVLFEISPGILIGAGIGEAQIFRHEYTGAPGDFVHWVAPDSAFMLSTSCDGNISYTPIRTQLVQTLDDSSEERIDMGQHYQFRLGIKWTDLTATDYNTVMDFYHSKNKGAGTTKTFLWEHPNDNYIYVVRFFDRPRGTQKYDRLYNITATFVVIGIYFDSMTNPWETTD